MLTREMAPAILYLCALIKKFSLDCVIYFHKQQKILREDQRKEE